MHPIEDKQICKDSKEVASLKVFLRVKSSPYHYYSSPISSEGLQNLNCIKKAIEEPNIIEYQLEDTCSFVSVVDNQTVRLEPVQHFQNCNCEICFKSYGSALSRSISKSYSVENCFVSRSCSVDNAKKRTAATSTQGKDYRYNRVFVDADRTKDIYSLFKTDISSVFEGFSCTVLTYGPPGSGKSTTMFGEGGLAEEAVRDLLSLAAESAVHTRLEMSFIELHNNAFRNLFARKSSTQQINDKKKMMTGMSTLTWSYAERIDSPAECIFNASGSNLIQIQVETPTQAMEAISAACKRITPSYLASATATATASTPSTAASAAPSGCSTHSKSHVILTFHVESQSNNPNLSASEVEYTQGKLHLIDLAAEVRVTSKSSARDSAESAAINLSLHTLGKVLKGLAVNCSSSSSSSAVVPQSRVNVTHVPFLDSKLTALLREPLTKGRTIMVACLEQVRVPYAVAGVRHEAYKQALQCLELAHIASRIKTTVSKTIRRVKVDRYRSGRLSQHFLSQSDDIDDEKTTATQHKLRHSLQFSLPSSLSQDLEKPASLPSELPQEVGEGQGLDGTEEQKSSLRRSSSSPCRRRIHEQLLTEFQQMERRSQEEQRLLELARHKYEGLLLELKHWGHSDLPLQIDIQDSCSSSPAYTKAMCTIVHPSSPTAVNGYENDSSGMKSLNKLSWLSEDRVVSDATSAIARRLSGHSSAMQVKRSIDQQAKMARQLCGTTRNCVLRYLQPENVPTESVLPASLPLQSQSTDNHSKAGTTTPTRIPDSASVPRRPDEYNYFATTPSKYSDCSPVSPTENISKDINHTKRSSSIPVYSASPSPSEGRLLEMQNEAMKAMRAVHVMSFARRCTESATEKLAVSIVDIAEEQLRLQKQRCALVREKRDALSVQVTMAVSAIDSLEMNDKREEVCRSSSRRSIDDGDVEDQENDFARINSYSLDCSVSVESTSEKSKKNIIKDEAVDALQSTGSFDFCDTPTAGSSSKTSFSYDVALKMDATLDCEKLQRLRRDRGEAERLAELLRSQGADEERKEANPVISDNPRERARTLRLAWVHMKGEEEASNSCVTLLRKELKELQQQQEKRRRRRKLQDLAREKAGAKKKNKINGNLSSSGILKCSFSNCTVLPSLPENDENDACGDAKVLPSGSIVCACSEDGYNTFNNFSGDDCCCYVIDQARSFSCSQDDSCVTTARYSGRGRNHIVPETMMNTTQQSDIII